MLKLNLKGHVEGSTRGLVLEDHSGRIQKFMLKDQRDLVLDKRHSLVHC